MNHSCPHSLMDRTPACGAGNPSSILGEGTMRVFISYKFTGKSLEDVQALVEPVKDTLEQLGHDTYCNLYDPEVRAKTDFEASDYVFWALEKLGACDQVLVLLDSSDKSEGMLLEVGYAIAKEIPVIVGKQKDVTNTYLPQMGNEHFEWMDIDDLIAQIKNL